MKRIEQLQKAAEELKKAKQEENSVATKAQLEQTTREVRLARDLEEIGKQIDFQKLTDGELTEMLGIRNGKAGKPASPKRTLEILRGAKARIDAGTSVEAPDARPATVGKSHRDG